MTGCIGDITGAGLTLGADHRRTLGDPAQRLTEIGGTAHERHGELPLIDVMAVIRRRQHLRLIDIVDPEAGEDLRLDEMSNPGLSHHRDADRGDDALDQIRITHPRHPTLGTDIGRYPLQRHYGHRTGRFGDARLLGRDHIHDHAALEHLGHSALDPRRPDLGVVRRAVR